MRGRFEDEVRPELRFHPDGQIGPPMAGEPPDRARPVDGHELVQCAVRKPLPQELRRSDRAGRDQDVQRGTRRTQAGDERQQREALPDAGAVHPDQTPGRTGQARPPQPLAEAQRILLAPVAPVSEPGVDERRGERARAAVAGRGNEDVDHPAPAAVGARTVPPRCGAAGAAGATGAAPTRRSAAAVISLSRASRVSLAVSLAASSASAAT